MIITVIVIGYIINIFLTRWLNKIMYRIDSEWTIQPVAWFIPIGSTILLLLGYMVYKIKIVAKSTWFTGKNW